MKKLPTESIEFKQQLTSSVIVNKDFSTEKKGYNIEEVDAYLDTIMEDYQAFEKHFTNTELYIAELERKLESQQNQSINTTQPISIDDIDDRIKKDLLFVEQLRANQKKRNEQRGL